MTSGIIRVAKKRGYFVCANEPMNDARLSWEARGVMGYLLSKPNNWVLQSKDLMKQGPAGRDKIRKIMRELQEAGYLERQRTNNDDGTINWETIIYETPQVARDGFTGDGETGDGATVDGKHGPIIKTELVSTELVTTDKKDLFLGARKPDSWTEKRWELFGEWVRYRKRRRKAYKDKDQIGRAIAKISRDYPTDDELAAAIDHSITEGYQGLFAPPAKSTNNGQDADAKQRLMEKYAQ